MNEWNNISSDLWNNGKKIVLLATGVVSIAVGLVLIPVPLIPGWPFLVFGGFCIKMAFE